MCGPSSQSERRGDAAVKPKKYEKELRKYQLEIFRDLMADYPEYKDILLSELGYGQSSTGDIYKITNDETAKVDEIEKGYIDRQLAALSGDLAVSPALEKDLSSQKAILEENLARKGVTVGSTPWNQAMDTFEQRAGLLKEESRRGDIALNEELLGSAKSRSSTDYTQLYNYAVQPPGMNLLTEGTQLQQPYQYDRSMLANMASEESRQQTSSQSQGWSGMCSFIFTATYGEPHWVVRKYRDKYTTIRNRRGYYWFSDRVVPLMAKHSLFKRFMKMVMTAPMTSYGKYRYKVDKKGIIFAPLVQAWLALFFILGCRPPYRRRGTDEIV